LSKVCAWLSCTAELYWGSSIPPFPLPTNRFKN
jgi:hypothetical protein